MAAQAAAFCAWGSSPHTRGARAIGSHARLCRRDHPRIRGEHVGAKVGHAAATGIIPAYAGNTAPALGRTPSLPGSSPHTRGTLKRGPSGGSCCQDHPRIRGEHGTSTPTAGFGVGIIPAYAGNTGSLLSYAGMPAGSSPHTRGTLSSMLMPNWTTWDHPRIRGEHYIFFNEANVLGGIIPAYAGNTLNRPVRHFASRGSSPHTRGTPCRP